ncbi:MAG: IS5 family transposase [Planctomycetes bacterium]|nr:IS5 family transposase [Planctomycetota bacterium]
MKPKKTIETLQQGLFQSRLDSQLDMKHPLVTLAGEFDWNFLEEHFGANYSPEPSRPGLPTRLLVALTYLKYLRNLSDESVVEEFIENSYFQYFCGYEFFQIKAPLHPTSLGKWRKRFGEEGAEALLIETIKLAIKKDLITEKDLEKVIVDTTVQEKAIAFPTDIKLCSDALDKVVAGAQERKVKLRQSYKRKKKKAVRAYGTLKHGGNHKMAAKELKKVRNYLGRSIRDVRRKWTPIAGDPSDKGFAQFLDIAERICNQRRKDKNKIYSLWAPEVECIGKGKAHKKYEFGVKVSFITTAKSNWIVGAKALHGNPYDGHSLKDAIEQTEKLTGYSPKDIYVDKGYKGVTIDLSKYDVHMSGGKKEYRTRAMTKWMKRRQAIEPVIGHAKNDHRMDRNFLHEIRGDQINCILAAAGFNLKKLIRAFFVSIFLEDILAEMSSFSRPRDVLRAA